jgi:hypothetical protein
VREEDVPGAQRIRSALERAATEDSRGQVRVAALAALEPAVDSASAEFAEAAFQAGYSWNTMRAAAALFVKAHRESKGEARTWLDDKMEIESPHDVLRAGLVGLHVEFGDRAALERLRGLAREPSESRAVRTAAVRGMGKLVRAELELAPEEQAGLRIEVVRELAELLKDRGYRLRGAALDELAAFEDPSITPILLAYYESTVFPRERRRIERGLQGLSVQ